MDILSLVTVQVMLPFSSTVVQKFTIKLKCIASDFFFLEIKPKKIVQAEWKIPQGKFKLLHICSPFALPKDCLKFFIKLIFLFM